MNGTVIHGENVSLLVLVDGTYRVVACETSCTYEEDIEIIAKTGVNSGLARRKRARLSDSRLSLEGVTSTTTPGKVSVSYFMEESRRRSELPLKVLCTDQDGNDLVIETTQIVQHVNITGEVSSFSTFSIQFEGSGPATITEIDGGESDIGESIICEVQPPLYLSGVEGEFTVESVLLTGREVLHVEREGVGYTEVATLPVNREFRFSDNGIVGTIAFDAAIGFNPGEVVFILFQ